MDPSPPPLPVHPIGTLLRAEVALANQNQFRRFKESGSLTRKDHPAAHRACVPPEAAGGSLASSLPLGGTKLSPANFGSMQDNLLERADKAIAESRWLKDELYLLVKTANRLDEHLHHLHWVRVEKEQRKNT